jgi:hypothetical protein
VCAQRLDTGLRDHAAVAGEADALDPDAGRSAAAGSVASSWTEARAGEDLDRDRPAARRADEPVADLELAALALARVAEGRE